MSIFQCENCGAAENTALSGQGCNGYAEEFYDWTSFEDRKGKKLCSACAPTKYKTGSLTDFGKWHDVFPRRILPIGMFKTNREGNLEHIETGDTDYIKYEVA